MFLPVGAGGENFGLHSELREAVGIRFTDDMRSFAAGFNVADRPQELAARDDDGFVTRAQEFLAAVDDLAAAFDDGDIVDVEDPSNAEKLLELFIASRSCR